MRPLFRRAESPVAIDTSRQNVSEVETEAIDVAFMKHLRLALADRRMRGGRRSAILAAPRPYRIPATARRASRIEAKRLLASSPSDRRQSVAQRLFLAVVQ
jgi:hypothetical protein